MSDYLNFLSLGDIKQLYKYRLHAVFLVYQCYTESQNESMSPLNYIC